MRTLHHYHLELIPSFLAYFGWIFFECSTIQCISCNPKICPLPISELFSTSFYITVFTCSTLRYQSVTLPFILSLYSDYPLNYWSFSSNSPPTHSDFWLFSNTQLFLCHCFKVYYLLRFAFLIFCSSPVTWWAQLHAHSLWFWFLCIIFRFRPPEVLFTRSILSKASRYFFQLRAFCFDFSSHLRSLWFFIWVIARFLTSRWSFCWEYDSIFLDLGLLFRLFGLLSSKILTRSFGKCCFGNCSCCFSSNGWD